MVQFDMHEKIVLLGFTSNFKFQMTVKEIQEDVAIHISATPMGNWLKFNQGFHLSDFKDGGTLLEDHCQYTAPRFLARYTRGVGLTQHTVIDENTRKYFTDEFQPD